MQEHNVIEKDEWLNNVIVERTKDDKYRMNVNGYDVIFQIDSGTTVSMLPREYAEYIKPYTGKILVWNK